MIFPEFFAYVDISLFLTRLAVGVVFIYHSLPKIKKADAVSAGMGVPKAASAVLLLGLGELAAGIAFVFGIFVQIAAMFICVVMVGAILMKTVRWHVPFSAMDKTGWEFDLVLLVASFVILVAGGGTIAAF